MSITALFVRAKRTAVRFLTILREINNKTSDDIFPDFLRLKTNYIKAIEKTK